MSRTPKRIVGFNLADVLLAIAALGCEAGPWRVHRRQHNGTSTVEYVALVHYGVGDEMMGEYVVEVSA